MVTAREFSQLPLIEQYRFFRREVDRWNRLKEYIYELRQKYPNSYEFVIKLMRERENDIIRLEASVMRMKGDKDKFQSKLL